MTVYYFDSSAVVKLYIPESGSQVVDSIFRDGSCNIVFAKIGVVEVAAAIFKHRRMGHLTSAQSRLLCGRFITDCEERFTLLGLDDEIVRLGVELVERHPLRGYDAVHLATAIELNEAIRREGFPPLTFVSADRLLNRAAEQEGLMVLDLTKAASEENSTPQGGEVYDPAG